MGEARGSGGRKKDVAQSCDLGGGLLIIGSKRGRETKERCAFLRYFESTARSCFSAFLLFVLLPPAVGRVAALALPRDSAPLVLYIIIVVFAEPFPSSQPFLE